MRKKMRKKPLITELGFEKAWEKVREQVRAEVNPFDDPSLELQKLRKERAKADQFFFAKTYLPHWASCDPAPMHREWVELANRRPDVSKDEVVTPVVIAAPRGFAKSTILVTIRQMHNSLYRLREFILILTETKDLSQQHILDICAELVENPRIIYDFGELLDYAPQKPRITLGNGVQLFGRGVGQAMRGVKRAQVRPDEAVADDLENDESAHNPKRSEKVLKWLLQTVYPALDPGASMTVIGTIISRHAAMYTMIHSEDDPWPEWVRRIYQDRDEEGNSVWPAKYSNTMLANQEKKMGWAAYSAEKRNEPLDQSDYFQADWFLSYGPEDLPRSMAICGFYDPARGDEGGDHGATVILGLDLTVRRWFVLHARLRTESVVTALKALLQTYKLMTREEYPDQTFLGIYFEDNGFQALIADILPTLEEEAGITLPTRRVTSTGNKQLRIESTAPYHERGLIYYNPRQGDQKILISQFLAYPRGKDDGPDSFHGALQPLLHFSTGNGAGYESVKKRRTADIGRGTW